MGVRSNFEFLPARDARLAGLGALAERYFFNDAPRRPDQGPLALKQGEYDWPLLAFAVGFGGSMLWLARWQAWRSPASIRNRARSSAGSPPAGTCRWRF